MVNVSSYNDDPLKNDVALHDQEFQDIYLIAIHTNLFMYIYTYIHIHIK